MKRAISILAALIAASAAQAASIQYSFSNNYVKTEVNQGGSLRFFDQSLGRLTGVSFSFDGGLRTWISLTNNSNAGDTLVGTSTSALFYSTDFGGLNSLIAADTPMLELKAVVKESVDAGHTKTGTASATKVSNWSPAALSGLYSAFSRSGSDSFNVSCQSKTGLSATGGGGNVTAKQSSEGYCGASVTYFYDSKDLPEPATLALLGLAATAAGVSTRRRKHA